MNIAWWLRFGTHRVAQATFAGFRQEPLALTWTRYSAGKQP
jgi:hypothetical protein